MTPSPGAGGARWTCCGWSATTLEAAGAGGELTPEQGEAVRDIAEQARHELVVPRAWPLDEGWEGWRPPVEWDVSLTPGQVGR